MADAEGSIRNKVGVGQGSSVLSLICEICEICGFKAANTAGWPATSDLLQKRISVLKSGFLFAWL